MQNIMDDNIGMIESFIDSYTDFINTKTKVQGLRHDHMVASSHVAYLQELLESHPGSQGIAYNIEISKRWQDELKEKLDDAEAGFEYASTEFFAAVSLANRAGIIEQTGPEWWDVTVA